MSHPIPAHDPLPKTPLCPHLSRDDAQPLVRRVSVLALHAHLEHFHRTGKNGVRCASHGARRGSLFQGELSERRDDTFRDSVGSKEQRVDTCDSDEGTGHPCVGSAGERRIRGESEEGAVMRTFVKCQNALFSYRLHQYVHGPFLRGGFRQNTGIEAGMELTNMPSIVRCKWGEEVSLIHGDVGEGVVY